MVYWLTLTYESSKIMGMDAVFVHMVEKYYVTNQAYWVDSAQLAKITERAYILNPILIGKKAPPITMIDSTGKTISLYDVKAKYTIAIFWDVDCGHCKKEIPKLQELYTNKLKGKGIEVYAIYSTPFIYLLDENKIIRAKHIDVDQLGDLIDILEKEKEREKKKIK